MGHRSVLCWLALANAIFGCSCSASTLLAEGIEWKYPNGNIHWEGDLTLVDGQVEGRGVEHGKQGLRIREGVFRAGQLEGEGTTYWPSTGTVHKRGNFKNGLLHGKGAVYLRSSGPARGPIDREGTFEDGVLVDGKIWRSQGEKHWGVEARVVSKEGHFVNGLLHGEGMVLGDDGLGRIGQFYGGALVQGTTFRPDDSIYEQGSFRNGRLHGRGKLFRPDGTLLRDGDFVDGVFVVDATHQANGEILGETFFPDGELHEKGTFKNGKLDGGYGTTYFRNDPVHGARAPGIVKTRGLMVKGLLHGQGETFWEDGTRRERGNFKEGRLHGFGMTFYPNGMVREAGQFLFSPRFDALLIGVTFNEDGSRSGIICIENPDRIVVPFYHTLQGMATNEHED